MRALPGAAGEARGTASTSLRPIGLPRALHVSADRDGVPLTVGRADARGRPRSMARIACVESVEDAWRVVEEWWRAAPQARTYYRVILDDGHPLTLYRDDATGAWFEQPYSAPQQSDEQR